MSKNKDIERLTTLMAISLRHRIGSIVNKEDIYANKYAKDAENLMNEAEKILKRQNWNRVDKEEIRKKLRRKLTRELTEKEFLNTKKFDIMGREIEIALRNFNL